MPRTTKPAAPVAPVAAPAAAAPVAASPVAGTLPTPAQVAAILAAMSPEQRKQTRVEQAALRAADPSKGELTHSWGVNDAGTTVLQLDVTVVPPGLRKLTGDQRPYLFNIDASEIVDAQGNHWKLSAVYATFMPPKAGA